MYGTQKKNLTQADKDRISARFKRQLELNELMTTEELKARLSVKMSSTDKYALELVIDKHIRQNLEKELEQQTIDNGNIDSSETDGENNSISSGDAEEIVTTTDK